MSTRRRVGAWLIMRLHRRIDVPQSRGALRAEAACWLIYGDVFIARVMWSEARL
jgi:hypothetical protein